MIEGLEVIPPLMVDYKGIQLREFNLDAALQRKPPVSYTHLDVYKRQEELFR